MSPGSTIFFKGIFDPKPVVDDPFSLLQRAPYQEETNDRPIDEFPELSLNQPNLRVGRDNLPSWFIEVPGTGKFSTKISVKMSDFKRAEGVKPRWQLELGVPKKFGDLLRAEALGTGTKILEVATGEQEIKIRLEVEAPYSCLPKTQARETVALQLFRRQGKGEEKIKVEVDYRCLVGDYFKNDPNDLLRVALSHRQDPMLRALLAMAPKHSRSLREEFGIFKENSGLSPELGKDDPIQGVGVLHYYALAPFELLRYGGDCEDFAILSGLYLASRGFPTELGIMPGHAFVRVREGDKQYIVDLTRKDRPEGLLETREYERPRTQYAKVEMPAERAH